MNQEIIYYKQGHKLQSTEEENMTMKLEKFKRSSRREMDIPTVTISRKQIRMNKKCIEKYFLKKRYAELYFDSKNQIIGILPLSKVASDSFKVKIYREEYSPAGFISATEFILKSKILEITDKIGRKNFDVEEGEKGMLLVRLK